MKCWFGPDPHGPLGNKREVRTKTRRDAGSPEHRTIIWVVVVESEVFVRSVRGPRGRWYREISSNPEGALHVKGERIPVHATPAADDMTVNAVSDAIGSKYGQRSEEHTSEL